MSTFRECICPIVVTRGNDQVQLSTRYEVRDDPAVMKNYGELLVDLSKNVPDGIVCFFTSYMYMERAVESWHNSGILEKVIWQLFIETTYKISLTHRCLSCFSKSFSLFTSLSISIYLSLSLFCVTDSCLFSYTCFVYELCLFLIAPCLLSVIGVGEQVGVYRDKGCFGDNFSSQQLQTCMYLWSRCCIPLSCEGESGRRD